MTIIFFFFVETAGKTLEELSEVFNASNPKAASLKRSKVELDGRGTIVTLEDA
jgi:hypothetical protein